MRTAVIFGAGEWGAEAARAPEGFTVAADGGLALLRRLGRRPDLILGDFDSYPGEPGADAPGVPVERHPARKDDTDMALAVEAALRQGAERIFLYGALGGRLDHTLSNLQLLVNLARRGVEALAPGPRETATAVTEGTLSFGAAFRGDLSVFAWGGAATVSERGLAYGLDRFPLPDDLPRGVSNEFTGVPAAVTVHTGTALLLWRTQGLLPALSRQSVPTKGENSHFSC